MTIRKVGSLFVSLRLDTAEFKAKLEDAQKNLNKSGRSFEQLGGSISRRFTLPLGLAGAGAIKMASDFESAFAGVKKTIDGTDKDYAKLEKNIISMSKRMPASAVEISRVAEVAGQLGQTKDNVLPFTETMIQLGETTNLSAEEAATSIARIQAVTKFPNDEVSRFGSVIVALGNNYATTESEIIEFTKRMAASGSEFGLTASQIAAVGATLSSTGVNAEAGGTAMQKLFLRLKTAVAQGNEDLAKFSQLAGAETPQAFQALVKASPEEAFVRIFEGMKKAGESGSGLVGILDSLGINEQRLILSTLNLAKNSDQLRDAMNRQKTAFQENTALTDEYGKRVETFKSKLDTFINRLTSYAIALGNTLIPIVIGVIDAFNGMFDAIEKLNDEMNNTFLGAAIKTGVQLMGTFALQLAGVVAVAGPVILAIGKIKLAMGALVQLARVALASNPLGLVFVGASLVALNFGKILDGLTKAWNYVVDAFKAGAAAIVAPLMKLKIAALEVQAAIAGTYSAEQAASFDRKIVQAQNELHQAEVAAMKWGKAQERVAKQIEQGAANQKEVTKETKKTSTELDNLLGKFGDGGAFDTGADNVSKKLAKSTKDGIEDGVADSKDSLIDAHKEAVQNWQTFFENAITGVKFDFKDMFKQIAVGFASELAASLSKSLGGFDLSSPQNLGSSLANMIFKNGSTSDGGFSLGKLFSMDSLFGSARPDGVQGPLLPSGDFSPGILSTDPGGLFAGAGGSAGYATAVLSSLDAMSKIGKSTEDSVKGIAEGAGSAIGAAFGGPVGATIGNKIGELAGKGIVKAFGLGGPTNPETVARIAAADQLNPILKSLGEFNDSVKQSLDPNLFNNFTNFVAERDFFPKAGEGANTFLGAGQAIADKLNIKDLNSDQLGVMLSDAMDMDGLRGLFKELNISQQEYVDSQKQAGRDGQVTWLEVASRIRDANMAFGEGLVDVGNYQGAMSRLIQTGGRGYQALIQMQNIGIEAAEAGITSLEGLQESLTASGKFTAEQIQGLMTSLANNGITSIDQLVNANEDTLINLVAGMDAAIQDAGGSWSEFADKIRETNDTLNQMDGKTIDIRYNGIFVGEHPDNISSISTSGSGIGTVQKFARGGIATGPTFFSNGNSAGVFGEAGKEGILPLAMTSQGLGVHAKIDGAVGKSMGDIHISIDARGAQEGVEVGIMAALADMQNNAIRASVDAVVDLIERGAI